MDGPPRPGPSPPSEGGEEKDSQDNFSHLRRALSGLADCSVVPSGPDTLLAVAPNAEALYMFSVLGGTPSGF